MEKEKFVTCDCFSSGLLFTFDDENQLVEITPWALADYGKLSWKRRIRLIWTILRNGFIYSDYVVFNYDKTKELGKFLTQRTTFSPPNS